MAAIFLALLENASEARTVSFAASQTIFRQGDTVRWLYLVTKGRVRLSRVLARGTEIALVRASGGAILAEASVFSTRYHCDAIAETPSTLRRFAMREVLALLETQPDAAIAYGAYLARQLMELRTTVEVRAIRRADDRLLAWLRLGATGKPPTFDSQGAWPSVARQIGLTPETLYRALATLERTGRIKRDGRRVVLPSRS